MNGEWKLRYNKTYEEADDCEFSSWNFRTDSLGGRFGVCPNLWFESGGSVNKFAADFEGGDDGGSNHSGKKYWNKDVD
jgi:hypothetical protein